VTLGPSQHMRDYMEGRIDSAEYIRRVKRDTDRMVDANRALLAQAKARSREQTVEAARRSLARAREILRRLA